METILQNKKIRLLLMIGVIVLGVYVVISYVLPLFWPVVVGLIMAKIVSPLARFLADKLQFNKKLANVLVLLVFILSVSVAGVYFGKILVVQVKNLVANWNYIMAEVDAQVHGICAGMERGLSLDRGSIYNLVSESFYDGVRAGKDKIISVVMNNSVSAFVKMVEGLVTVIVAVMSAYFFMADEDEMKKRMNSNMFAREIAFVGDKISFVFKAYFKAQLIIMLGSAAVCFVGLTLMGNPYSLILAIGLGVMDALPLLGLGIVLVPWAVVLIFAGSSKNAIVLLITFVLCYILREVLESRLIGEKVGISPVVSLITIYAGYKLFGIMGVIFGPVVYVLVRECVKVSEG